MVITIKFKLYHEVVYKSSFPNALLQVNVVDPKGNVVANPHLFLFILTGRQIITKTTTKIGNNL